MIGVWVNCATVVIGGVLGTLLRGGIQERYRKTIHAGLALCVMLIGVSGAIKTSYVMIVIVSMVIGSLLGELAHIEDGLDKLGTWAQKRFAAACWKRTSFSPPAVSMISAARKIAISVSAS